MAGISAAEDTPPNATGRLGEKGREHCLFKYLIRGVSCQPKPTLFPFSSGCTRLRPDWLLRFEATANSSIS